MVALLDNGRDHVSPGRSLRTTIKWRMDLGLSRVQALLRRVGSPHTKFPVIHVAGTNGKGSTTAYLDALLTHGAGVRSGRFNSPHLVEARDSVRVSGGVPIDGPTWERARQQITQADADASGRGSDAIHATPFELLTAQALLAFTMLPPDTRPHVLLIEVGLGGRLDATNVFPDENVLASVICPIARDHEGLLGHGLAAIAREKAGIIKENGLCVVADQRVGMLGSVSTANVPNVDAALVESLQQACSDKHARVAPALIPWDAVRRGTPPTGSDVARLRAPVSFSFPLHATGTAVGAAPVDAHVDVSLEATLARLSGCTTALQTLWSIAHDTTHASDDGAPARQALRDAIRTRLFGGDAASETRVQRALAHYHWEGRSEWRTLGQHTPLLLDGAHNEASAIALRQYLDQCLDTYASMAARPVTVSLTWIMAFSKGKDATAMLRALLCTRRGVGAWECTSQRVGLVPFSTPVEGMPWVQPAPPPELAQALHASDLPVDRVHTCDALRDALAWALASKSESSASLDIVVVCGSLYLVSDYYRGSEHGMHQGQ